MSPCSRIEAELSAYLDGELTAPQHAAVEAHLANCAACRQVLTELREVAQCVSRLPRAKAPAALADELRGLVVRRQAVRIVGAAPARTTGTLVSGWVIARRFSAAAAAILLCIIFGRVSIDPVAPEVETHDRSVRPAPGAKPASPKGGLVGTLDAERVEGEADAPQVVRNSAAQTAADGASDVAKVDAIESSDATAGHWAHSGLQSGAGLWAQPELQADGVVRYSAAVGTPVPEPTVSLILQSSNAAEYRVLHARVAELARVGGSRAVEIQSSQTVQSQGDAGSVATDAASAPPAGAYTLAVRPQDVRPLIDELRQTAPDAVEVAWRWDHTPIPQVESLAAVLPVAPPEEPKPEALAFEAHAADDDVDKLARPRSPPGALPAVGAPAGRVGADTGADAESPSRERSATARSAPAARPATRPDADGGLAPPAAPAVTAKSRAAAPAAAAPSERAAGSGRGFAGGTGDPASQPGAAGGSGGAAIAPSQPAVPAPAAKSQPPVATSAPGPVELKALVPDAAVRMFDDVVGGTLEWLDSLEPSVTVRITILPPEHVGPPAPPEALYPATPPSASSPARER